MNTVQLNQSDDIEKQEMEEMSDEDEISYYNTKEYFTETDFRCGSKRGSGYAMYGSGGYLT